VFETGLGIELDRPDSIRITASFTCFLRISPGSSRR
jgi:hypothetical protein